MNITNYGQVLALSALAGGASADLLLYLTGAFIAWDFNPGNWPQEGRFLLALMGLFGFFGFFIFTFISICDYLKSKGRTL